MNMLPTSRYRLHLRFLSITLIQQVFKSHVAQGTEADTEHQNKTKQKKQQMWSLPLKELRLSSLALRLQNNPGGWLKPEMLGPSHGVSDSVGLEWGWMICVPNK